ncbi:helix-turn-helix transcriptional regulator [Streptomyces zagrosensis]|uniref:Transcriptional regulator with XRE-family HTH domain n=1 Tax=Streptomyces zagrosensis TaxID=1042984 RepID=A0A7W9Q419_9ACTN|nr:helix-turn-helix transcriptional regulator [Streptomyces zagrosensis]MBB5933006.1 transcriptional regulator with XRE-family HTH domain [Streptomyces zagrosensis]
MTEATVAAERPSAAGAGGSRKRPELTVFLRSRRARVSPAAAGIPPGFRRRTPGLRREEVAQLSGVGITWYTWLEQGRPINASAQVLDAVARTLQLDPAEREHLYHLAEVPYVPNRNGDTQSVSQDLLGVIEALDPLPAVIYNARYDILAANTAYQQLFPMARTAPGPERNALWQLFTRPKCCCPVLNREEEIPKLVATLRAAYGRHVGEPAWESFLSRLSAASEWFARLWEHCDVAPPGHRVKLISHASVGEIRLTSTSLTVGSAPETRVVVYTPNDEESRDRVTRLRTVEDPLVGCPKHVRPISALRPNDGAL